MRYTALVSLARGLPILAVWNLGDSCNFQCGYCSSHSKKNGALADPARVIRKIKRMGIKYAYLQGGEPLLRKDLDGILSLLLRNGIKPTIITNGSLIDSGLISSIRDRDINLSISMPSLDPKCHERITGSRSLKKIIETIKKISGLEHQGNWSITTTVTAMNIDEIGNIERFAANHGFMFAMRPYMHGIGRFGRTDKALGFKDMEEASSLFKAFSEQDRNRLASIIYSNAASFLSGEPQGRCDAGRYSILVNADGSISPCIEMPGLSVDASPRETLRFLKSKGCTSKVLSCNQDTPCFHGCGRNIGILLRNKRKSLMAMISEKQRNYLDFF